MSGIYLLPGGSDTTAPDADPPLSTFEEFFRATYPSIVSTAFRITGSTQEAEEVASEAFARFSREKAVVESPVGWLKRCAVRLAVDCLRSSRRRKRREEASPRASGAGCPESSFRLTQQRLQVRHILAELPKRDAEILLARAEGFSYLEIAESFGLNPASVGKALVRAEANFKRRYVSHYGTD